MGNFLFKLIKWKLSNIAKTYFRKNEGFVSYNSDSTISVVKKITNLDNPYIVIVLVSLIYLFAVLKPYEFTGEEPLRVIVAYEMLHNHNLFQPTFLGDIYLNKPPLFNWFIILSSYFIGWSDLTARMVTLFFLFLTSVGIYKFSFELTKDEKLSTLSSIIFLSFIDILFWYGNFGEIDITLGFFVFLLIYFLYKGYTENKPVLFIFSGIFTGIAFLLKGFPAYLFFGFTYLSIIIFYKDWKRLINPFIVLAVLIAFIIPVIWIINVPEPLNYIKTLFLESTERGKGITNPFKFIYHIFVYLSLNFKQLLPASFFVVLMLFIYRKKKIHIPENIKLLIFIILLNYIPYLLLVETRGRYIIPLFPIISIVFAYIMYSFKNTKIFKIYVYTVLILILVRLLFGYIHFPVSFKKRLPQREVAQDIYQNIDTSKKIAFDCYKDKFITAYLDFMIGRPLLKSKYTKDWDYILVCKKIKEGKLLKVYKTRAKTLYLYQRLSDFK